MRIAVYSSFTFHMECIGFILKYCHAHSIVCDIYINQDQFQWMDVYYDIHKEAIGNISYFESINSSAYDCVIRLSSNDRVVNINGKVVSIVHRQDLMHNNDTSFSFLPMPGIPAIFPIFGDYISNKNPDNIITYVGHTTQAQLDNEIIPYAENTLPVIVITYCDVQSKSTKVKVIQRPNSKTLINYVNMSKYILIRNYPYQLETLFSGALCIAVSLKKPMIINRKTADVYGLRGVEFEESYMETCETIKNMSPEGYLPLLNDAESMYNDILALSHTRLEEIIAT